MSPLNNWRRSSTGSRRFGSHKGNMETPLSPSSVSSGPDQEQKGFGSFRFLDLPGELRLKIYRMHLLHDERGTIDLEPLNFRRIAPRLRLFLTCRLIHEEAYRVFYGDQVFRLFSVNGKFFNTRRQLVTRLSPRYRAALTQLELRVGPGWTAPPKSWAIGPQLGLRDMTSLRALHVFVECDPDSSRNQIFVGFRKGNHFYTKFCGKLLQGILAEVPSIKEICLERFPSVSRDGPLVMRLIQETVEASRALTWGSTWKRDLS